MRWPKLRVRMLLALVAVAAIGLGVRYLRDRASHFRALSSTYRARAIEIRRHYETDVRWSAFTVARLQEVRENLFRFQADGYLTHVWRNLQQDLTAEDAHAQSAKQLADFLAEQARKYDRVARRPWESVAPDSPEPRLTDEPDTDIFRLMRSVHRH